MAEAHISVDLDELSCSICLDLLKDPVTIPCGHSYCIFCIKSHWDLDDDQRVFSCPQCRQSFTPRPVLNRNTMLAKVVGKLQNSAQEVSYAGPEEVPCDICTGRKLRAVKSCLVCLVSYCETHIQPHYEATALKKHNLCQASKQLKDRICPHHDKLLEVYCCTDQQGICYQCAINQHRSHDTVEAPTERAKKQNCHSFITPLGFVDIPSVPVGHQVYFEKCKMSTSTLKRQLQDICSEELVNISETDTSEYFGLKESKEPYLVFGLKESMEAEDPETNELFVHMGDILEQLSPKTFQQLMGMVTTFSIDTEDKLKGISDLIFERAIAHPALSEVYANMCRCIVGLKVPKSCNPKQTLNFRKLLLNRCQKEFEDFKHCEGQENELDHTIKEKSQQRLSKQQEEAMFCRRYIGIIKFICELFRVKMLTEAIIYKCIQKLFNNGDETSLEGLCTLFSKIGKDLDDDKRKSEMDEYYRKMKVIIERSSASSRILYMLQDVVDLRKLHEDAHCQDFPDFCFSSAQT